eukprot:1010141-Prymnesium_polylepis.1
MWARACGCARVGARVGVWRPLFVDDVREAQVEDDAVVDGDAEEDADQLELALVLEARAVEPKLPQLVVVDEHAKRNVEDLRHDELEKLLLHAALVDAVLARELHLERLLEVLLAERHLQQRVGDQVRAAHLHNEVGRRRAHKQRSEDGALKLVRHLRSG